MVSSPPCPTSIQDNHYYQSLQEKTQHTMAINGTENRNPCQRIHTKSANCACLLHWPQKLSIKYRYYRSVTTFEE